MYICEGELFFKTIYNSPANSLQINASIKRHFQKYIGSRRQEISKHEWINPYAAGG